MKKPPAPAIDVTIIFSRRTIAESRGELKRLQAGLAKAAFQIQASTAAIEETWALLSLLQGARQESQSAPSGRLSAQRSADAA